MLAEIETDKATMGFETPEEGYLAKILVQAGEKNVAIGRLVCIIVADEGSVAAFKDFKDDGSTAAAAPPSAPAPPPPAAPAAAPPPPKAAAPAAVSTPSLATSGDRVFASPLARRLASEQGLSLQVNKDFIYLCSFLYKNIIRYSVIIFYFAHYCTHNELAVLYN